MLNFEEYKKLFINIKDDLFENCIKEEKERDWNSGEDYISYKLNLSKNLKELLKENDTYHEITDIINQDNFIAVIKNVYYEEINKFEYLKDGWSSYSTTYKCYKDFEGNTVEIKNVIENKLDELKEQFIENLTSTYDKYVKGYELKQEYIIFANNIKKAGFEVCDYQRRGELRVPCTFIKEIDNLELYVRKNATNYRIYMKCKIGGRYGMTVDEFEQNYEILKRETNSVKNALMGEEII